VIDYALGVGVNLTPEYYGQIAIDRSVPYDFLEIDPHDFNLTEPVRRTFSEIARRYPVVLHSTTLSLCGDAPLDAGQLGVVGEFARLVGSQVYSDHLCFTRAGNLNLDLYMTPAFTDEMLHWVRARVETVIAATGVPFVLENVGMIVGQPGSGYTETEFLRQVAATSGAGLQLNLDSVAVSAAAVGRSPLDYLQQFPLDLVETVAVVPKASMNPALRAEYGQDIDKSVLEMFDAVMAGSPVERVMVQRRPGDSSAGFDGFYLAVRDIYDKHRG